MQDAPSDESSIPAQSPPPPRSTVGAGALLGGRYKLVALVGRGGFNLVWQAEDIRTQRPVAIKLLPEAQHLDPTARAQLLAEIKTLVRISAANGSGLVEITDHGEDPVLYLVMRFFPMGSLRDYLDGHSFHLRPADAVEVALQIAGALLTAHAARVYHLDLKPANILLLSDPVAELKFRVLLSDFGSAISRPTSDGSPPRGIAGTLPYMPREQWFGDATELGPACDVYALGILLYELICGEPPFRHDDQQQLFNLHDKQPPDIERLASAGAPRTLSHLINRMLSKLPADRPAMSEVAYELRCESQRLMVRALTPPTGVPNHRPQGSLQFQTRETDVEPYDQPDPLSREPAVQRVHRRVALLFAAGAALLLVGLLGYRVLKGRHLLREASPAIQRPGTVYVPRTTFKMGKPPGESAATCSTLGPLCDPNRFRPSANVRDVIAGDFYADRDEVTNRKYSSWINLATSSSGSLDFRPEVHPSEDAPPFRTAYASSSDRAPLYLDTGKMTGQELTITGTDSHVVVARKETENRPVTSVTWYGAERYCEDQGGRLPTEAEWELLATGGKGRRYPWGSEPPDCDRVVYDQEVDRDHPGVLPECLRDRPGPKDVGASHQDRTPEGINDLGGNVAEWVYDSWANPYPDCSEEPCIDPVFRLKDDSPHVVRGSAWAFWHIQLFTWWRDAYPANTTLKNIGFRCVYPKHPLPEAR